MKKTILLCFAFAISMFLSVQAHDVVNENNSEKTALTVSPQKSNKTKKPERCPYCGGSGSKKCYPCKGTGRIKCGGCRGTGVNPYSKKHERCSSCNGKGDGRCNPCNGRGTLRCSACRGTGQR